MTLLSTIGSIASILALFVAIVVSFQVRKLSQHYVKKARLPKLLADLKKLTSRLSTSIGAPTASQDIRETLAQVEAKLEGFRGKLEGPAAKKCKAVKKTVSHFRQLEVSEIDVEELYLELMSLVTQIHDQLRDSEWES